MQWIKVDNETERASVPGGWFVRINAGQPFFYADPLYQWKPAVTPPVIVPPVVPVEPPKPVPAFRSFKVKGTSLIDPNGTVFTPKGVNHTVSWGHQDNNFKAIKEIAKTGANCVRLAVIPNIGFDTPAEIKTVLDEALKNRLVPILGCWTGTGKEDASSLTSCVDFFLKTMVVLKDYSDRIILNIANEWGSFDGDFWLSQYTIAIKRLRDAGFNGCLMIDAGGAYGQNPRTVRDRGSALLAADPLKNVVFSVHFYAYWRTKETASDPKTGVGKWNDQGSQSPWLIVDEMKALQAKGLCVVIGEVAYESHSDVGYKAKSALSELASLSIGWIAWGWNQNDKAGLDLTASPAAYVFNKPEDLSDAGKFFVLDPDVGIKATSKLATNL